MQKSLYQLHQNPQTLQGYSQRWRVPEEALKMLQRDPKNLQLEQQIAHDPELSYMYARLILDDNRFELGEPAIMRDPPAAYNYAKSVLKRAWPEAEPSIMKDPESAYWYVRDVLERRWPEAEPYIMKDPNWAYYYARDVLDRNRFLQAEPSIMKIPNKAYYYARDVLRRAWPEAEPYIRKDPFWWKEYKREFEL